VGKARLDKAIARLPPQVDVLVTYRPFMIDPATKPEGEPYLEYNRRRWGGDGWTRSLRAAGKGGFNNWVYWPNTYHASRTLLHAGRHGCADRFKEECFKMCYEEGENLSLRETVAAAAERAGVPGGAEYALGNDGSDELTEALDNVRSDKGERVTGVPFYSIQKGAYSFSGAQDTDRWLAILEHFAQEQEHAHS
jgi:predicted DsbA family dithiol-disulfide isomerase